MLKKGVFLCSVENVAKELIEIYNIFVSKVEELNIPSALDAKPLLDVCSTHVLR
jgi:hypothetical protein